MKHRPLELPWPAVGVGIYCVLQALFLFAVSRFAPPDPAVPPFRFESFWFERLGSLSLQMVLMGGNLLLATLLWIHWRLGPRRWERSLTTDTLYAGTAALLGLCQWGCRELSMAAPNLVLEIVP